MGGLTTPFFSGGGGGVGGVIFLFPHLDPGASQVHHINLFSCPEGFQKQCTQSRTWPLQLTDLFNGQLLEASRGSGTQRDCFLAFVIFLLGLFRQMKPEI